MAHDVFISYSSKDKPTADAVCHALEADGLRCWIAPRDIQPGADWGEAIVRAISGARVFILVFSANANASQQIKREVERAVNRGLPVIPFRIENVAPTESLEYFISTPHWLDAYTPPLERHLEYLSDTVAHLLRGETAPKPAPIPRRKRPPPAQLAYLGALAALSLALLVGALIPPSHVGSFVSSKVEAEREALGTLFGMHPIDQLMVNAVAGPSARIEFRNDDGGFYQMLLSGEDSGTVRAQGGELVFTSSTGGAPNAVKAQALPGRLIPPTMGSRPGDVGLMLEAEGKWQQMWAGRPAEDPGALLPPAAVGEWRSTYLMSPSAPGQTWAGQLSINKEGAYVLKMRRKETGQFEAARGRWKRNASLGAGLPVMPGLVTDQGTYKWRGRHQVTYRGQFGTTRFRRIGPYKPLEDDPG